MKEKESDIVRGIVEYLSYKGYLFIRNNSGAFKTEHGSFVRFGQKGSPDIIVFLDGGIAVGIECKTSTGRLSPAQLEWQKKAEEIGMLFIVARSIDDLVANDI